MEVISNWEIHCGDDIRAAIMRLDHEFYVGIHKKFPADYVFDENQSVKWNREEVERKNKELQDEVVQAREMKCISHDNLEKEIIRYIMDESVYGTFFSEAEARAIWQHTKNHHDTNPWDWVDEMADTMHEFQLAMEVK